MALTKVSYSMIQGAAYNVLDFGADPTGAASSVVAFNAAVANGGTVYIPTGMYKLDSKVTLSVDNTTLFLGANVTLNLSGVPATQSPFGNQIHVYANNCAVIGSGESSLIQITNGSYANGIGIFDKAGLLVRDLTLDGGKSGITVTSDDSFGSAISIIADTGSGATTDVNATVDNCFIKNWSQYGVNVYGNLANGVKVVNCNINSIGITAQSLSVGAGIVVTRAVSDFIAANNVVKNCKQNGIFVSSAGVTCSNYAITGNICHQNGASGIGFFEESDYGSVSGQGINNIVITGNICTGNTRSGVQLNVNTVGFISYASICGNTLEGNTYAGLELGCTNTSPNILSDITIAGNECAGNTTANISISNSVVRVSGYSVPFTPVLQGSTTAGTGTYTSVAGSYMLVGNVVTYQLDLAWSAHTGTGYMQISGFPYAATNSEPQPDTWVFGNGVTVTGQLCFGQLEGSTVGNMGSVNNGSYTQLSMQTSGSLRITGSYIATV